jgi:hypothetical protein
MIYGKDKWGPKAWHLLHMFSLKNNKNFIEKNKHNYYIFYSTFAYVLPCIICSEHYAEIIINKIPLNESLINKTYLKKWVFKVHNNVNHLLKKNQYSYDIFKKEDIPLNNKDIFFFIDIVYRTFNYDMMSLYKYDNILNFFINFCLLYPEEDIRKNLKKIIKSKEFKNLNTPLEFKEWFINNKKILENIFNSHNLFFEK